MTHMNKFLGLLLAVALAVLALPADAQNQKRQFEFKMTPPTEDAGVIGAQMNAAVINVSPDGISTFKALRVYAPTTPAGIKITDAKFATGSPFTGTITLGPNGTYANVDNISPPVKPFDLLVGTVNLTLTVDGNACGAAVWSAGANTGGTFGTGGQPFVGPVNAASQYTTTFGDTCSFSVATQVVVSGGGTGGTLTCTPSTGIPWGTSSTCTATTPAGYTFNGLSGDCTTTSASCTLTNIKSDKSVTASYTRLTYTIATNVNPAGGGSVTCVPAGTAQDPVPWGTDATCTATASTTPSPGYFLANFSGDCSGTTCTLTNVTSNKSVTANFALMATGGPLACSPPDNYASSPDAAIDPDQPVDFGGIAKGDFGIRRGVNKDDPTGDNCTKKVGVSLVRLDTNSIKFLYDKTQGQNAMFKYYVVWPDGVARESNWSKRPKVSWKNDTNGNPLFYDALTCTKSDLAADAFPYDNTAGEEAQVCVAMHGWFVDPDDSTKVLLIDLLFDKADSLAKYP